MVCVGKQLVKQTGGKLSVSATMLLRATMLLILFSPVACPALFLLVTVLDLLVVPHKASVIHITHNTLNLVELLINAL